jgi:pyruvate formate lyase activating enzyme
MRIGGLQKTTLLDFPGKVSAVVFMQGCNFRCPYCHNAALAACGDAPPPLSGDAAIAFLARRRRVLEGVVISGGEPTLHADLAEFCAVLKGLGYAVKLDTNGSDPEALRRLLALNLLDYVAMDIKADPGRYPGELGPPVGDAIVRSVEVLSASKVAHEFRVPCVFPFITDESFQAIARTVRPGASVILQPVRLEQVLEPSFFTQKGRALRPDEMERLCARGTGHGCACSIRGARL